MTARNFLIIHNPKSGRKERLFNKTLKEMKSKDANFEVLNTKFAGQEMDYARMAVQSNKYDTIVVAGGDGTINKVSRILCDHSIALGIIPTGTANVLAKELGIKSNPGFIADMLLNGPSKTIRMGLCNDKIFLLMVGVGFDAWVVKNISPTVKSLIGKFAYVFNGLKYVLSNLKPEIDAEISGVNYKANWVVISKSQRFGGKWVLAKEADISQPFFIVTLFSGNGFYLVLFLIGIYLNAPKTRFFKCQQFKATELKISSKKPEPIQGDGDFFGCLPAEIKINPQSISLIIPQKYISKIL